MSKDKELNKRRQAYMRAHGYTEIKVDGSWGQYQQKIWDRLTTRKKNYDTTLVGLISAVKDKLTKNDTYKVDPLDSGTIKKYNSNEVDWGKTRRSQNKSINALSGTWLPVATAVTLPALVSTGIATTGATLGGGLLGAKAVDAISKKTTGRNFGNLVSEYTPLSPDLGEMFNPGAWLGGTAWRIFPFGKRIITLDTKYNTRINTKPLEEKGWKSNKTYHSPETSLDRPLGEGFLLWTGGVHLKPGKANGSTTSELHFNPDLIFDKEQNIVGSNPVPTRSIKEALQVINSVGENVPLSQNRNAKPISLALQQLPFFQKLDYIITGKNSLNTSYIPGYSTDIYPTMQKYADKGFGHLEKSATTRIDGTNMYGRSYAQIKNYFGTPDDVGSLRFKDMTPEQVAKWNSEKADQFGMHIDPETRTAEQYIFVTGETPQQNSLQQGLTSSLFNATIHKK